MIKLLDRKKNILILGGDSKIGLLLKKNFRSNKINFISTTRNKKKISKKNIFLDLKNFNNFIIPNNVDIAYFCLSITSINICSKFKKETRKINVFNTFALIKKLLEKDIYVVYFSTNLVFNKNNIKISYNSKFFPQNEYSYQKVMMEEKLQNFIKHKNFVIIRFGKIIFKNDKLLISWLNNLKNNKYIIVAKDRFVSPIFETDAYEFIKYITFKKIKGTYQLTASDYISYEDIANKIIKKFKKTKNSIKLIHLEKQNNSILKCNLKNFDNIKSTKSINIFLKNFFKV